MKKNWAKWLMEVRLENNPRVGLEHIRNLILTFASLNPTDNLLDIGTGLGLLGFKAYDQLKKQGKVVAIDNDPNCISECLKYIEENKISANYELHNMDLINNSLPAKSFDVVVSRSVIMHIKDKQRAFNEIYRLLKNNGKLSIYEPFHFSKTRRFHKFLNPKITPNFKKYYETEEAVRNDLNDPLTNYDIQSLKQNLKKAGFSDIKIFSYPMFEYWKCTNEHFNRIEEYLSNSNLPLHVSLKDKFLKFMSEDEFNQYLSEIKNQLFNKFSYIIVQGNYILALKNPSIISKLNFWIIGIIYGIIFDITNIIGKIIFHIRWFYLSSLNKKA